jgi:hypothetical protein
MKTLGPLASCLGESDRHPQCEMKALGPLASCLGEIDRYSQ